MIVNCPNCNQKLEVEEKYLGENFICPSCNKEFETQAPKAIPIAPKATKSPQKQAQSKKSSSCSTAIWCIVIVIAGAVFLVNQIAQKIQEKDPVLPPPRTETDTKLKVFDEGLAQTCAVRRLEKAFKTPVETTGKYTVKKLPPPTIIGKDVIKGDIYAVEQNFIETNVFNVKIKRRYRAVVEFRASEGYRVIWFMVDGVRI